MINAKETSFRRRQWKSYWFDIQNNDLCTRYEVEFEKFANRDWLFSRDRVKYKTPVGTTPPNAEQVGQNLTQIQQKQKKKEDLIECWVLFKIAKDSNVPFLYLILIKKKIIVEKYPG